MFQLTGQIISDPTKYSIQLDAARHLTTDAQWQYVNHGCEPNVRVDIDKRLMIVIRDIAPGEELRFNYNTTEWDMASPFECLCGAESCIGRVRGFRYLPLSQRNALRPWLSPLLESRFDCFD